MQQLWMGAADTGENFKILPGVWKPVEYGIKIRESVIRQTLFTTLNDKILSNSRNNRSSQQETEQDCFCAF